MKAYTIHKFYVCQLTGSIIVEASSQLEKEYRTHLYPFSSVANANAFLNREKRDWLLFALEKFVLHKKHIIEQHAPNEKTVSLKHCLDALAVYQNYETSNVCKMVLKGFKHYETILPNLNNPSYQSSLENLFEIKTFCETELKIKP